MLRDAFKTLDFEAVLHHGQAMEMIYQNNQMLQPLLQQQKKKNRIFQAWTRYDEIIGPMPVSRLDPAQEDISKKVIEVLEARGDIEATEKDLQAIRTAISWWRIPGFFGERERLVSEVAKSRDSVKQIYAVLEGRDKSAAQEFSRIYAEILRIGLEQSTAVVSGDPIQLQHALSLVDEMEKLSQTEFGAILVDPADIKHDRQLYRWKRELLSSKWKAAMQSLDYSTALAEIERLYESHGFPRPLNRCSNSSVPDFVVNTFESMEWFRIDHLLDSAEFALERRDFGKAVDCYQEIIQLNDEGAFSNLKPGDLEERMKKVREANSKITLERIVDGIGQ